MLNCEKNTRTMEKRIRSAFRHAPEYRGRFETFFEHGQWWITDKRSGAQWSVNDASVEGREGFSFEMVTPPEED